MASMKSDIVPCFFGTPCLRRGYQLILPHHAIGARGSATV